MNPPGKEVINKELEDITCLYEVTRVLASSKDLRASLAHIMEVLSSLKNMHNGTVTIINPLTGQLEIEVAHGMPAEARKRGKYKVGEGITGRVVATGQPIVIPHIGEESQFLNRTRTRGDISRQQNGHAARDAVTHVALAGPLAFGDLPPGAHASGARAHICRVITAHVSDCTHAAHICRAHMPRTPAAWWLRVVG